MILIVSSAIAYSIVRRESLKTKKGPPRPPPPSPDFEEGKYCVRAKVRKVAETGNDVEFIGLSKDMDILRRTEEACKRSLPRGSSSTCSDPLVAITPETEQCDGRVIVVPKNGPSKIIY